MLLAVTGNSGCGQTTFAGELDRLGAGVCSLDRVGHRLLQRPAVASEVAGQLGIPRGESLSPAELRREVGRRVFADADLLARLNAVIHPMMRRWAHISARRLRGRGGIWVLEGALVLELGLGGLADMVVVVSDTLERCRCRAAARDGVDPASVEARWAAQWSMARKESAADAVVRNRGGREELTGAARALYRELARK
jgi:dephospho-CoA kinase